MALIETLVDTFSGGSLGAQWASGPTPSGGALDCSAGTTPAVSSAAYTAQGSYIIVKLTTGTEEHGTDAVVCPASISGNAMGLARTFASDHWSARQFDSSFVNTGSFANFGGTDQWAKMVFVDSGTVEYYSSPDGTTWTLGYTYTGANGSPKWDGQAVRLNFATFDQVGISSAISARASILLTGLQARLRDEEEYDAQIRALANFQLAGAIFQTTPPKPVLSQFGLAQRQLEDDLDNDQRRALGRIRVRSASRPQVLSGPPIYRQTLVFGLQARLREDEEEVVNRAQIARIFTNPTSSSASAPASPSGSNQNLMFWWFRRRKRG